MYAYAYVCKCVNISKMHNIGKQSSTVNVNMKKTMLRVMKLWMSCVVIGSESFWTFSPFFSTKTLPLLLSRYSTPVYLLAKFESFYTKLLPRNRQHFLLYKVLTLVCMYFMSKNTVHIALPRFANSKWYDILVIKNNV